MGVFLHIWIFLFPLTSEWIDTPVCIMRFNYSESVSIDTNLRNAQLLAKGKERLKSAYPLHNGFA
jgi:hypothetical protein